MSLVQNSLDRCSGVCKLILPWRNNLRFYQNDNICNNSNFSGLTLVDQCSVSIGLRSEGTRKGLGPEETARGKVSDKLVTNSVWKLNFYMCLFLSMSSSEQCPFNLYLPDIGKISQAQGKIFLNYRIFWNILSLYSNKYSYFIPLLGRKYAYAYILLFNHDLYLLL